MDDSTIHRYTAIVEELRRRHRWTDANILRLAASSLAAAEGPGALEAMEAAEGKLRERAGWTGPLATPVRFVLAAMVVRRALDAGAVHAAVEATRAAFRDHGLRRSGTHPYLAAFLLVVSTGGSPPEDAVIGRMAALLERWKSDHPWLTGADDYPMAALHAGRGEDAYALSQRLEAAYEGLHRRGFSRGNQLQLATHILAVTPLEGAAAAARFAAVVDALSARGETVGTGRYDEVALLAVLDGEADVVSEAVLRLRDAIRDVEGGSWFRRVFSGLSADLALSLAVALLLTRTAGPTGSGLADSATAALAQAVVEAQQAAAIGAIAATSVAASSS